MGQWNKTEQDVKRDNETELALCVCGILEEGPHEEAGEEAGEFKRTSVFKTAEANGTLDHNSLNFF
jgi:hypothetical protein